MKTIHINFPIWTGDDLYYIENSTIEKTYVYTVNYKLNVCTKECENTTSTTYHLQNEEIITEKDLGVKYFTDKKELIQKLVSQL